MNEFPNALVVSGCLGALVGLVRQWSEQQAGHEDREFAGLRTFAFLALLGHLAAYGSDQHSTAVLPVTIGMVSLYFAVVTMRTPENRGTGYSTFTASLLAMLVGALVHWKQTQGAVMVTVATAALLAFKQSIHAWTAKFTTDDIRCAVQFAAVTGVILPLVPDQGYGPYEALNPRSIWMMVVLISGLGFVGYVLMRMLGTEAGITLTGLVGGLASSTATTLALSRRSKEVIELSSGFALAVVLACTVMLGRVAVMILAVNRTLFADLAIPLLLMALPGVGFGTWFWLLRKAPKQTVSTPQFANPLSLGMAIKFALLYGLINLLVKAASSWGASSGLMAISAISGMTDMDAIALSMANNVSNGFVTAELGARAVLVAAVSNTLVKAGMAVALGSPPLRRAVAIVLGATAVVGLTAAMVVG
jgi:uncharacterized membrane protein (DUF4010 family)